MIPAATPGSAHMRSERTGWSSNCHISWSPLNEPCPVCTANCADAWVICSPSLKRRVGVVSSALKSCTIPSIVLVNNKMMIVIDIVSFWRWLMVSKCVLDSMWAPRIQFPTDIPYLKAMARLRVLVSQKSLRIICEQYHLKGVVVRLRDSLNCIECSKFTG